ncbi:hypothetical protein THAOC_20848, partial [Thalassiosira oceanica]
AAVDAAGLADTLDGNGTFTVFAPPDSSFAKLPEDLVTKLLDPTWSPQLQDVLLYHVLGSEVFSTDLAEGLMAPTVNFQGDKITVSLDPPSIDESVILIDDGLVDIEASNGVIHAIDSVLTPPSISNNIVDVALGNEDFSTLVAALTAAGLVDTLSGEGPFTVFAPTNAAFDALPEGTLDSLLLEENVDALSGILTYHAVAANALSSSLVTGDVETLNGATVAVTVDDGVMVNDSTVKVADIVTSNGIIHVIDAVLLPPSDEAAPEESTESEEIMDGKTDEEEPVEADEEEPVEAEASPLGESPIFIATKAPQPHLRLPNAAKHSTCLTHDSTVPTQLATSTAIVFKYLGVMGAWLRQAGSPSSQPASQPAVPKPNLAAPPYIDPISELSPCWPHTVAVAVWRSRRD